MRTIGLRATPKGVTFAIYDSNEAVVLNIENIKVPAALSMPEALKYIRNNILDVLREYDVQQGGIRVTESAAPSKIIDRIQIEGVIQEAFASSPMQKYYIGQISNISSRINIQRSDFKKYVEGEVDFERVTNWTKLSKDEREALLTAIGAVNA